MTHSKTGTFQLRSTLLPLKWSFFTIEHFRGRRLLFTGTREKPFTPLTPSTFTVPITYRSLQTDWSFGYKRDQIVRNGLLSLRLDRFPPSVFVFQVYKLHNKNRRSLKVSCVKMWSINLFQLRTVLLSKLELSTEVYKHFFLRTRSYSMYKGKVWRRLPTRTRTESLYNVFFDHNMCNFYCEEDSSFCWNSIVRLVSRGEPFEFLQVLRLTWTVPLFRYHRFRRHFLFLQWTLTDFTGSQYGGRRCLFSSTTL